VRSGLRELARRRRDRVLRANIPISMPVHAGSVESKVFTCRRFSRRTFSRSFLLASAPQLPTCGGRFCMGRVAPTTATRTPLCKPCEKQYLCSLLLRELGKVKKLRQPPIDNEARVTVGSATNKNILQRFASMVTTGFVTGQRPRKPAHAVDAGRVMYNTLRPHSALGTGCRRQQTRFPSPRL
jgi:hypothetical protein